jgi:hypothetical protein
MMGNLGASWARAIVAAALCIGVLAAFPGSSLALNSDKYCSAGSDPTKTQDTISSSSLSVNDVRLWSGTVHTSSDCYGSFDPGNSSPANETAAINQIFGDISHQFTYLDKTGAAANASGLGGIKFEVHTVGGDSGAPGLWTIVWTSTGAPGSQFPLEIDLVVLLVGGNQSAAYLLSGILIPFAVGGGIGTFDIQFPNVGALTTWCHDDEDRDDYDRDDKHHYSKTSYKSDYSKNKNDKKHKKKHHKKDCKPKQPDISHLLIAGRVVPTQEVPEPATMAMFGAGLVGLWVLSRRRRR